MPLVRKTALALAVALPGLLLGRGESWVPRPPSPPPVATLTNEARYIEWKWRTDVTDPRTGVGQAGPVSVVGEPFAGLDAGNQSQSILFGEIAALDTAADDAWRGISSAADYNRHRAELRRRFLAAIGPLPDRTPLKTRVVETVRRPGYRLEKLVFESRPGVFVPAYRTFPESPDFKAPYPGVAVACGHSKEGKGWDGYLHAAVLSAQHGFAAIVYDPVEQGERASPIARAKGPCVAHNFLGAKAVLLGQSLAAVRIWDGMRAIDCLLESSEVDATKIGFMGNSGGGTMTSLMMCADPRIRAAAPSCFLTNLREVCDHKGPQDAEQNVFGQLAFGLNHAGYVLMSDIPVLMVTKVNDNFSFHGSLDTYSVARGLMRRLGKEARVALYSDPGPHGWTEGGRLASLDWMRAWMCGEESVLPLDVPAYRLNSIGYTDRISDGELPIPERNVVSGDVLTLEGAKDYHTVLAEESDRLSSGRAKLSLDEKRQRAATLAGVRLPSAAKVRVKAVGNGETNGVLWTRLAFQCPNGLVLPAVLLEPMVRSRVRPRLFAGTAGREAFAEEAFAAARSGAPALVADVTGCGEIGKPRYPHYGNKACPEEGMSWMLYLLGESMVGRRATDILVFADELERRYGLAPEGVFADTVTVAAAHAVAAAPEAFAKVSLRDAPTSWTEAMRATDPSGVALTWSVQGALKHYDWVDLIEEDK